jgi:hypothetical protein
VGGHGKEAKGGEEAKIHQTRALMEAWQVGGRRKEAEDPQAPGPMEVQQVGGHGEEAEVCQTQAQQVGWQGKEAEGHKAQALIEVTLLYPIGLDPCMSVRNPQYIKMLTRLLG